MTQPVCQTHMCFVARINQYSFFLNYKNLSELPMKFHQYFENIVPDAEVTSLDLETFNEEKKELEISPLDFMKLETDMELMEKEVAIDESKKHMKELHELQKNI